ncbi:efflux RND transporter periplasmic adaptor subunit [Actinoplanes sp. NPDC051859]|uniref:efflux RND transporter periplasmic adaptor subunit n=1 Tax=Actinoplanes sp. NPDC051859 TaxID=3363909 RepID=UPI0037AA71E0
MRRRWVVGGLAVVSVAAAMTAWVIGEEPEGGKSTPAMVGTDRGPVTVSVAATGSLQAATTRSLAFTVAGTVDSVAVKAGTKVKAGTVLAALETTNAATAVNEAQTSLASAETQLTAAEAAADSATRTTAPTRAPSTTPATPVPATIGPVAAGLGGAALGGAGQPVTGTNRAAAVDAVLTAQQRVNRATITLAEAKLALAGATIKAPIDGTVMSVEGVVGNQVRQGTTFVTLADTDQMQITANFPEADAGALAVGQPATVTLADRVGQEFPAKVAQVDPVGTSDGTLVTYGVLLSFTAVPSGLLVGQTAAVEVTTGEVADALRVPSTAVHEAGDGAGSVLVRSGTMQAQRSVQVGLRGDQYTEITGGLTAGELVVRAW